MDAKGLNFGILCTKENSGYRLKKFFNETFPDLYHDMEFQFVAYDKVYDIK
jgi:hypothetical protein